jgi:hypothetical protein
MKLNSLIRLKLKKLSEIKFGKMRLSIENRLSDDKELWREKGRIKRLKSLSKKQGINASGKTFRILINKWLENIKKICNWKKI